MTKRRNRNAPKSGGAQFTKLAGRVNLQSNTLNCDSHHISKIISELRTAGLQLRSTVSDTQLATLPKVLQYLGSRGLGTFEGTAAGYARLATRIKDIKNVWVINIVREDVVGPDGLFHKSMARYIIIGKRKDLAAQGSLDLGTP